MHLIRDTASLAMVSQSHPDPELRSILTARLLELSDYGMDDIGELAHFIVMEEGDHMADLEALLGFPVLSDPPIWEVIESESYLNWYALVYVLGQDGFGVETFIPKELTSAPDLMAICKEHTHHPPPDPYPDPPKSNTAHRGGFFTPVPDEGDE
jgi:hypothetical protein